MTDRSIIQLLNQRDERGLEETIGKVNVFSIEGKSVLGFEMKVITKKLRHPSMHFYAEDDGFAGKLKP